MQQPLTHLGFRAVPRSPRSRETKRLACPVHGPKRSPPESPASSPDFSGSRGSSGLEYGPARGELRSPLGARILGTLDPLRSGRQTRSVRPGFAAGSCQTLLRLLEPFEVEVPLVAGWAGWAVDWGGAATLFAGSHSGDVTRFRCLSLAPKALNSLGRLRSQTRHSLRTSSRSSSGVGPLLRKNPNFSPGLFPFRRSNLTRAVPSELNSSCFHLSPFRYRTT